jgi:gluconolactonase
VDPKSGQIDKITDEVGGPNGICFSPDYEKVNRGHRHAPRYQGLRHRRQGRAQWGASFSSRYSRHRRAVGRRPGIRCDVDGNLGGRTARCPVISANGERIGMIRLPETCANVCFGGAKRNRLFMTASQSLYVVYVETTGAHIA